MTQYYDASTYQSNGWTADIGRYIEAANASGYDWDDFFPAARFVADIGGQYTDRVAITSEAQVLVYRTDILAELGAAVPATFDELAALAERITAETRHAGITLRGASANWWPFYGVTRSFGGEYVELPELTPVINSPETRAALEMYARLAATAPRGVTSYDWDEINTAMLSGQAALFLDSSVIYGRLQDPEPPRWWARSVSRPCRPALPGRRAIRTSGRSRWPPAPRTRCRLALHPVGHVQGYSGSHCPGRRAGLPAIVLAGRRARPGLPQEFIDAVAKA